MSKEVATPVEEEGAPPSPPQDTTTYSGNKTNLFLDNITNKLSSRKFWIILAYGFVALFAEGLGIDIDPDQLEKVGWGVMTYLGAQGAIDFVGKARS